MFNAIVHLLCSGDILNFILNISFLIYAVVLIAIYGKCKIDKKKFRIWCFASFVPLLVSLAHCVIFVSGEAFLDLLLMYKEVYIPAILIALLPLLAKQKVICCIGKIIIIIACIFCSLLSIHTSQITNYTRQSLSDAYVSMCDYLEENYIMNEWKKIDYDKLKKEYLPLVQEAEKTGDLNKYYEAVDKFLCSFHDAHMGIFFYNESDYFLKRIQQLNDYGLSLITLDDGTTIAIDVEEGLEIRDGDIVTQWNGVPIEEAIDNIELFISDTFPENEKILKTFYLAGVGGDTVTIRYINSNNEEVTTTLNKMQDVTISRVFKAFNTFLHSNDSDIDNQDFFTHKMIDNKTGYLLVRYEETNVLNDYITYLTGDHKFAREQFRTALRELREQGMTQLVIDIRNNSGGYEEVSTALASLFTKEQIYAFSLGVKDGDALKSVEDRYVLADGEFSDIEVLVLTNMRCASAGDGLSLYLSRIDNITVAGLTNPGGCNQETGGYIFMPGGVAVGYPIGLVLDQDGNPNIDIDETRISRNPVDIKIPLDKGAALKIFNGVDYELEWAINYLNSSDADSN